MAHNCFISYKSEDIYFKNRIVEKLGRDRIVGKSVDQWIESDNIDYIMQEIRRRYMAGTTVTIFLIGNHSSENEGLDYLGRNKQAFIIRELQATLYDRQGNPRDGLLGVVLPSMENKIYTGTKKTNGTISQVINISDETVIREFSVNYWLSGDKNGVYSYEGHYPVLCRYSEFMQNPERFIEMAYEKTKADVSKLVHFKDISHRGM